MIAFGKVALIYPYFRTRSPNEILFPPLKLAALAGRLLDMGINRKRMETIREKFDSAK
jgi:hypothetical protein